MVMALALGALAQAVSGCQLIGGSRSTIQGPPGDEAMTVPVPQGDFLGFLEIDGGRLNGTLTITPAGGVEIEGFLEVPPDMVAIGQGRMRDRDLRLELSYEGACPGQMTLVGRWVVGSGNLTGVVRARDCTGNAEGTFLFQPA